MKISAKLSQSQRKNAALVAQGINPQSYGMKPGMRVERDRKQLSRAGYSKHKGKMFVD